jgi:hypothetical protein
LGFGTDVEDRVEDLSIVARAWTLVMEGSSETVDGLFSRDYRKKKGSEFGKGAVGS